MLVTKPLYRIGLILIVLCIYGSLITTAQNSSIRFHHYTASEGLSQNMVDCILKDSKGFIWIGTWNGLNRFDGYDFTIYKHTSIEKNTIANNFVYCIDEDHYGNIWIGTRNGLTVYNYLKTKFTNYKHIPDSLNTIVSNTINDLLCDNNGNIWLATPMGLNKVTADKNGLILSVQYLPSESINITCLHLGRDGILWIGTENGLFYYDNNHQIKPYILPIVPVSNTINTIYVDTYNNLWIGTDIGLLKLNKETNDMVVYYVDPEDNSSIVHNSITSMTEDIQGNFLIGTLGGLCMYNREDNTFKRYTHRLNATHSLNNDFINCLLADEDGMIWIGTERGGVNKYSIFQKKFEYLENEPGNPNSLNHKTVNSILEDSEYIWIGTAGGGLNRYNKSTGKFKHFTYQSNYPSSLANDFVPCLHQDKKGNLWVGSWGGGLQLLTPENKDKGNFIHFRQADPGENGLVNDFISTLVEDKFGNIWIGTLGGLNKFNPEKNSFKLISGNNKVGSIDQVGTLLFDSWDNLWIGCIQGLYKINADEDGEIQEYSKEIRYFSNDPFNDKSLSGNYIISLCSDKNNDLWIGTYGGGLNKFEIDKNTGNVLNIIRYDENVGLSNNVIYTILEDNNGLLWMSSDNGLIRFNPVSGESRNYFVEDGLQSNQYYWSAAFKNKNGKLYFGGMNGLNAFYPDSITDYVSSPEVVITGFNIYNNSVEVGKKYNDKIVLEKSVSFTDNITISYKSNEFSFEFSALDYEQPEKNLYAYRMLNFEENWTYVNAKRRFASYTNLEGGEYTFQVKAANSLGGWDTKISSVKLKIIPPFWARWWFRITVLVISIMFILLYIYIRTYNLTRQKRKLEKQVHERTSKIEEQKEELQSQASHLQETNVQLEKRQFQIEKQNEEILSQRDKLIELNKKIQLINQQRLRFFTQISHEFRTPLTLIISPLEKLLGQLKKDPSVNEKLSMINKNVQRLLHLINQLMEIRKFETGKVALNTSYHNITEFVDNIANAFKDLAQQRNITMYFNHKQKDFLIWFDKDKIENIIYNLISNAIKYSPQGGDINISSSIVDYGKAKANKNEISIVETHFGKDEKPEEFVEITIKDTGIGIKKEDIKDIFKRFFRVNNSQQQNIQGTGIGLFITKNMIKAHMGNLFVRSQKNKGSQFRILLPVGDKHLSEEQKIPEIKEQGKKNHLHVQILAESDETKLDQESLVFDTLDKGKDKKNTVLVVDDDVELNNYVSKHLSKNFNIIQAANGRTGWEKVIKYEPDLIVSDVMMPEMDGMEFCSRLKTEISTSHLPVILLTAKSEVEDFIDGLETGADDYIAKPFNADILTAKIKSLIDNRNKLRSLFLNSPKVKVSEITTTKTDSKFLQKAIGVVEKNIQDTSFDITKFTKEMYVSRSLLHKKLKALTDMSASEFIKNCRLKRAAEYLLDSELTISEVAYETGFNDPKYFTRCFNKQYGTSPSKFKKGKRI